MDNSSNKKIKIPVFMDQMVREEGTKEDKDRVVSQWKQLKLNPVIEKLVEYSEKELDRLVLEDERDDFLSKFTFQSTKAKRMGERKRLRQFINYFK